MRLFPIHILIKDLSFMIFYLLIMKFDLTNETFLPETIREFPGATDSTFGNIISASFFYNWIPILVSFILYYPLVLIGSKIIAKKSTSQLLLIGLLLSLSTPLIYIFGYKIDIESMKNAEIISWILTFALSILAYYFLNNQSVERKTE